MRQLITRIDDDLHRRLKQRAAEQNQSVNELVTAILRGAVGDAVTSARQRIERSGLRVLAPAPLLRPDRATVIEAQRGSGAAVAEALAADREHR